MAEVTMDIAELDALRNTVKEQAERIDKFKAEMEICKKTVYVENKIFKVSFDFKQFEKDIRDCSRRTNEYLNFDQSVEILLKNGASKYISISEDPIKSFKSYIGLDEFINQVKQEVQEANLDKLNALQSDCNYARKQKDEAEKKMLECKRSVDVLVREKTMSIIEEDQKEILSLHRNINNLQMEVQRLSDQEIKQELTLAKSKIAELENLYQTESKLSMQNAIDRDRLRDKLLDLIKQIKRFEKRKMILKPFHSFDYSEHLL